MDVPDIVVPFELVRSGKSVGLLTRSASGIIVPQQIWPITNLQSKLACAEQLEAILINSFHVPPEQIVEVFSSFGLDFLNTAVLEDKMRKRTEEKTSGKFVDPDFR